MVTVSYLVHCQRGKRYERFFGNPFAYTVDPLMSPDLVQPELRLPWEGGPAPMVLSGWMAHEDVMPYDGTLTRGDKIRAVYECWDDDFNGLVFDNYRPP